LVTCNTVIEPRFDPLDSPVRSRSMPYDILRQLEDTAYDTSGAADCQPDRGYDRARVRHGGWGRSGYILDTRIASATGEHPIYPFCDDGPIDDCDLLPEQPIAPALIEPFGLWRALGAIPPGTKVKITVAY